MRITIVDDNGDEWTTWTQGRTVRVWMDSDGDLADQRTSDALSRLAQVTRDDKLYPQAGDMERTAADTDARELERAGHGAPAVEQDDAFTVRERTDRYGYIYDVVSVTTGAIVRDGVGGTRHALTFASQSAACEWARWLNDGKPPITRARGVPGTATMGRL